MRNLSLLFLLTALALTTADISGSQANRPIISVETNLVTLPVTVTDRHGHFVAGLTADQFAVYDNNERQTVEFFSGDDTPATVGLVIDSSGSMREHRDNVTAAATAFASLSHPLDELFTVNFNERVWAGLPPQVAFADNVEQLRAALASAPALGMTAVYDAVDLALDHLESGSRDRRVLIVVSDGGDNASSRTLNAVLDHAHRAGAVIYAIILADPDDREARPDVLKTLARDTGGTAISPKRVQQVMEGFAQIAKEIRSGYAIGFSPATASDDAFHTVRVIADAGDGRKLTVRTRAGYYAGRTPHLVR